MGIKLERYLVPGNEGGEFPTLIPVACDHFVPKQYDEQGREIVPVFSAEQAPSREELLEASEQIKGNGVDLFSNRADPSLATRARVMILCTGVSASRAEKTFPFQWEAKCPRCAKQSICKNTTIALVQTEF